MSIIDFLAFFLNGHCTQACCWMNRQISRGFKAYLGDKKILKVFLEIRPGTPPTPMKQRKTGTFVFNGRRDRTCCRIPKQISGGFSSCLGRKKMFLQFWETRLGRPPTFNPKVVRKKIAFSRLHREPGNRPRAQTLLFLQKARPILFKTSGGSTYLGRHGRELCWKNENAQYI